MSLALLLLYASSTLAMIPEPPNIFYGRASLNGKLLTKKDTDVTITAKRGDTVVASYTMGTNPAAQDRFVLTVPLDTLSTRLPGTARPGDVLTLFINDQRAGKVAVLTYR
jgi:hypothetical protein